MEKKTIGTFIAVLRKASGMTQRELAERLNVSDKSVSRWERDECAPDLSLIPVIAEIFDVTTDELLRGERKASSAEAATAPEEESVWKKEKSSRQLQNLLRSQTMRLKERSMIALGVSFGGWLAAIICNFAFYRATLGFFLSLAFYAAAVILEVCFLRRAAVEKDESFEAQKWCAYQNDTVKTCVKTLFATWLFFGATLPLVFAGGAYTGLALPAYLLAALLCTALFLVLGYLTYVLAIKPALIKRELLLLTEKEKVNAKGKRRLLAVTAGYSTAIAAVLLVAIIVITECTPLWVEPLRFDDYDSFKKYMETEPSYMTYEQNGISANYGYVPTAPDSSFSHLSPDSFLTGSIDGTEEAYELFQITDQNGNVLCEYYDKNEDVARIAFSFDRSEDGLPVYVTTYSALDRAEGITADIVVILFICIALDYLTALVLYLVKARTYTSLR